MVIMSDKDVLCFDIAMHIVIGVQVAHCFADILEIATNELLAEMSIAELDLFVEGAL